MDTRFGVRWKRLRETVEAMRVLWTQPEPSYNGELVRFPAVKCDPKPRLQHTANRRRKSRDDSSFLQGHAHGARGAALLQRQAIDDQPQLDAPPFNLQRN
jgi:hypothetical protein